MKYALHGLLGKKRVATASIEKAFLRKLESVSQLGAWQMAPPSEAGVERARGNCKTISNGWCDIKKKRRERERSTTTVAEATATTTTAATTTFFNLG